MIIKLNEGALLSAGLPRDFVQLMRHVVRQLGELTEETTLPEVAALTDGLTPIVSNLVITVTATNAVVAGLEVEQINAPYSDARLVRRLEELESALELACSDRTALLQIIQDAELNATSTDFNIAELARRVNQLEAAQP